MKKITTEEFILKASSLHQNAYKYHLVDVDAGVLSKVTIVCPIHGPFTKRVFSHLQGEGCPKCSQEKKKRNIHDIIKQAEEVHGKGTYDYSLIENKSRYTIDKVDIICPTHGKFTTTLKNHIIRKSGCPSCYLERKRTQLHPKQKNISQDSLDLLENKIWLKSQNWDNNLTLIEIGNILGVSVSTVWSRFQKHDIPTKHLKNSLQEQELSFFVKNIDNNIQTNVRNLIPPYEIDIVSSAHKLCIEYNGNIWHSENFGGKTKNYHEQKRILCQEKGFKLIQIFEDEWVNRKQIVMSRLNHLFGVQSIKKYARNSIVEIINNQQSETFFNATHIQGHIKGVITYGLIQDGEILAAMSFGKPRFNKSVSYELLRFSTKLNTHVVGGASKLFNAFIKEYNPDSIISYADKRWSIGNLYKQLGFKHIYDSPPNYKYFKYGEALNLYSRQKFQKHKLRKLLEIYDETRTEWENMKNNNFDRIWDCGNMVWVWKNEGYKTLR